MSRVFAALPRAVAFVAIGAALLLGFLWVNEPLLDQPEPGLFGRKHIEEDVVHLVDPGIVSEGQWQMGETSARLALILSAILIVSVLATWRKRETRDPQLRSVGHGARMRRVKRAW